MCPSDSPPRVLLVAPPSSYRIAAYIRASVALGIELVVASEGEHSLVSAMAGGVRVDLRDPASLEILLAAAGGRGYAGVIPTDDSAVPLAGRVAASLGLPHNTLDALDAARRKDHARRRLSRAGLPVPAFRVVDLNHDPVAQLDSLAYPCVVKPLALSGSRGVIRVDDRQQLREACRRVRRMVATLPDPEESQRLLVESYIPGIEVALEGLLRGGELTVLALFDKPDPLEGPYFEETYYITPSRLAVEIQSRVERRVLEACRACGLSEGPVHAELRIHAGEAYILEVAARTIGGQCARLLRFGTGRGLEELVLSNAVGRPVDTRPRHSAAGVLMIPIPRGGVLRRVEGVSAALKVRHIDELSIDVREGYELVPLPEGASYLGFIFAHGPDAAAVENALRTAHARLDVVTAPILPVLR